jgi:hypothetical protein
MYSGRCHRPEWPNGHADCDFEGGAVTNRKFLKPYSLNNMAIPFEFVSSLFFSPDPQELQLDSCGKCQPAGSDPSSPPVERRKHVRYTLRLPVLFSWKNGRQEHIEDGCTGNISTHGVQVTCKADRCPPIGKRLTVTLVMPAAAATAPGAVLKGAGRVIRRETAAGELASFAVETFFKVDLS